MIPILQLLKNIWVKMLILLLFLPQRLQKLHIIYKSTKCLRYEFNFAYRSKIAEYHQESENYNNIGTNLKWLTALKYQFTEMRHEQYVHVYSLTANTEKHTYTLYCNCHTFDLEMGHNII